MPGEHDLSIMLKNMSPVLQKGAYVFCSVNNCSVNKASPELIKQALATFQEKEGLTLILKRELADEYELSYDFIAAWIRLDIHSALDAVGLTAAFSQALGQANISCNVVAAYYHDHIFVALEDAEKAMEVLLDLAKKNQNHG